jgi:hypothetical protein
VPDCWQHNCRTNLSAIAPLDLRASGPTAQIHINGHRGPAPHGACSRSREPQILGSDSDSADCSLHTDGPDNPNRATLDQQAFAQDRPAQEEWRGPRIGLKAETTASRAGTGRDQDVV